MGDLWFWVWEGLAGGGELGVLIGIAVLEFIQEDEKTVTSCAIWSN